MEQDIEKIAKTIKFPIDEWPGNCFAIASMIVESKLITGTTRYGIYHGPIHENSIFNNRIARHGWIELPNNKICDPTRWVFECKEPYIFIGNNNGEYDIGGNDFKMLTNINKQIPDFNPDEKTYDMPSEIKIIFECLTNLKQDRISMGQIFYLANMHPKQLDITGKSLFTWLQKNGLKAVIPMDNWQLIMEG